MTKLLILRGAPGSGKSTYAKTTGYRIINRDFLREVVGTGPEDFYQEEFITYVQNHCINYHLSAGTDVVVDNTNCRWSYVKDLAKIAKACGAHVGIKVIDTPLEECLRRNAERGRLGGRQVPDDIITRFYNDLQLTRNWKL